LPNTKTVARTSAAVLALLGAGPVHAQDCNGNRVDDALDISLGTSLDCNGNGIPDECDVGVFATSPDCNANGIPDECEPDCNGNGIPDECEANIAQDCNGNGIPDSCDLFSGLEVDCNGNGLPDSCETAAPLTLYSEVSPPLTPIGDASPQSHTFTSPPFASGPVTVELSAVADLAAPTETLDVFLNGVLLGTLFATGAADCPVAADVAQLAVGSESFNALVTGADAVFDVVASSAVDPLFCPGSSVEVRLTYFSGANDCNANGIPDECELVDNDCNENGVPDECDIALGTSLDTNGDSFPDECAVYFVDDDAPPGGDGSSWLAAFDDLSDALDAAVGGSQVWVAQGTYLPSATGDRDASFEMKSGVAVYGGFLGTESTLLQRAGLFDSTILSGDLLGDDTPDLNTRQDNSFHVVRATAVDNTGELNGFTIQSGNARSNPDNMGQDGAGLWIIDGAPKITRCTFFDNRSARGGAVFNDGEESLFVSCDFLANNGLISGGAVHNEQGVAATFANCTFAGNGLDFVGQGGAVFSSSLGAPFGSDLVTTFVNCVFTGNAAPLQGGAYVDSSSFGGLSQFLNCTIVNNTSSVDAPAIRITSDADLIVTNSILWNNSVGDQIVTDSGLVSVNYSCVQSPALGALGGTGNTDLDPMFVDIDGPDDIPGNEDDDLRLTSGSPCLDSGDGAALPADDHDLDLDGTTAEPLPVDLLGGPRVLDGDDDSVFVLDMGALEKSFTAVESDLDNGETIVLIPESEGGDATEESAVSITNVSGPDDAAVEVSESAVDLHTGQAGFAGVSKTLTIETSLQDGEFFMTVSIPFDAESLGGANPALLDLAYFDTSVGEWVLAAAGNVADSPGFPAGTKLGDRCSVTVSSGPAPPAPVAPCADLGDYGVYWNTTSEKGFVWANVDHATDFAFGLFEALPYGCDVNPAGSLVVLAGHPILGTTYTVGVDDPSSSSPVGSFAIVLAALNADPNFPCGTELPAFGMSGPTGELLVNVLPPDPVALLGPVAWNGAGVPAPIALVLPNDHSLAGLVLHLQGLMVGAGSTKFTGALKLRLAQ